MSRKPFRLRSHGMPFKQVGSTPAYKTSIDKMGVNANNDTGNDDDKDKDKDKDKEQPQVKARLESKGWRRAADLTKMAAEGALNAISGTVNNPSGFDWDYTKRRSEIDVFDNPEIITNLDNDGNPDNENDGAPESKTYSVTSGDSLSKIAKDNNTTVEEIMKNNPQITDANVIHPGDEIKL